MALTPTFSVFSPSEALRKTVDGKLEAFDPTKRRHPWFNLFHRHWRFMHESYQGGPEYVLKGMGLSNTPGRAGAQLTDMNVVNLFPYFKEGAAEYRARLLRAHRKNYSRNVVDKIRSFLARKPPSRRVDAVSPTTQEFWKNVDGKGRNIDRFMAMAMQWAMVFGLIWIHVNKSQQSEFPNAEAESETGSPFARFVFPFDIIDAGFDDRGQLKWIIARALRRLDSDPLKPSPLLTQFEVWDKEKVTLIVSVPATKTQSESFRVVGEREHGLGFVPFHAM